MVTRPLVDILNGSPVGGLVFAQRAVAGDIWESADLQVELDHAVMVGRTQKLLYAAPRRFHNADTIYDRQVRLFGDRGQEILAAQKVAIIGAGGQAHSSMSTSLALELDTSSLSTMNASILPTVLGRLERVQGILTHGLAWAY